MNSGKNTRTDTDVLVVRIHKERRSEGGAVVERLELSKSGRSLLKAGIDSLPSAQESTSRQAHGSWVKWLFPKINEAA